VTHGPAVVVFGEKRPAMSVSWGSGLYIVFFSDLFPGDPGFDDMPERVFCAHCFMEDEGDEQLGEGLDLAKIHGQVDWDVDASSWFVPDDAARGEA
jgi:hypothetical protein